MDSSFAQGISQYGFLILIFVVFFFVLIFPQKRREKKIKTMLANIKPGNKVKTIGGVYGKVVSVKDDLIVIETGPEKIKIVFVRGAIAAVDTSDEEMDLIDSKDIK